MNPYLSYCNQSRAVPGRRSCAGARGRSSRGPGETASGNGSLPGGRVSGNVGWSIIILTDNYNLTTTVNHKVTKAQRKFVSDISMQSNPHNSAKSQKVHGPARRASRHASLSPWDCCIHRAQIVISLLTWMVLYSSRSPAL